MARVLITRPNASENNNGISFRPHEGGGMISDEIEPVEALKLFPIGQPGYELVETKTSDSSAEKPAAAKGGKGKTEKQTDPAQQPEGAASQGSLEVGGNGD